MALGRPGAFPTDPGRSPGGPAVTVKLLSAVAVGGTGTGSVPAPSAGGGGGGGCCGGGCCG
ncbi:hypothetical protein ACISU4_33355 [Streptomyces wuyuanensis]|uniref:hypothetical protein n=1 Tax=Streptomyces wuyuanensis TaxID=1196353 RepID=UPI0037F82FEA